MGAGTDTGADIGAAAGAGAAPRAGGGIAGRRRRARGQQRERIEYPWSCRGQAHAQVDIRLRDLLVAARTDRADGRALRDGGPLATAIEPRCVSVTEYPSAVSIVTLLPEAGTVPAKVTVPETGASTADPSLPPTSMPRCCPAAYGCAGSKTNGWSTGPSAGHVQAFADRREQESNQHRWKQEPGSSTHLRLSRAVVW